MKNSRTATLVVSLLLFSALLAACSETPKGLSSFDSRAKELLRQMTLEEKIGQMTQPEQDQVLSHPGDMQKYFMGEAD